MSNKLYNVIKIVFLVIVLTLVILLSVSYLRWMKGGLNLNVNGELIFSESYEGVGKVDASAASCALRIVEGNSNKTTVNVYKYGFGQAPDPVVSMDGSTLNVSLKQLFKINFGSAPVIEIVVPAGSKLDYELFSASGSIKVNAQSGNCNIKNTSGSVKVYRGGDDLEVEATSGSVRVYEPFENCTIECISGSVRAVAGEESKMVFINCTSGSVKLQLTPENLPYDCEIATASGSIKNEYADSSYTRYASFSQGKNGVNIHINATSGSVRLSDWSD